MLSSARWRLVNGPVPFKTQRRASSSLGIAIHGSGKPARRVSKQAERISRVNCCNKDRRRSVSNKNPHVQVLDQVNDHIIAPIHFLALFIDIDCETELRGALQGCQQGPFQLLSDSSYALDFGK